jgi:PHP family Zn ribbon phosphoesterase
VKTRKGFLGTIEFFPEEGKYHNDGHRECKVNSSPGETVGHNYLCPVCNRRLTVGVMHRVNKLADREDGFKPEGALPFYPTIPLPEILGETFEVGPGSKKVDNIYQKLIKKLGNEFKILLDSPLEDIESAGSQLIREAVSRVRSGNVSITPGFDGEFGKIKIFNATERGDVVTPKQSFEESFD